MDRVRRLRTLWNWLPAFRVVAETENVHEAALLLRVSPSALSRSVRLLEEEVGQPLFLRAGRLLKLAVAGEELLAAVRDAFRIVDDGLRRIGAGLLAGPVYLMSPDALVDVFLVPALQRIQAAHSDVVPHVSRLPPRESISKLLRGQLDVAFFTEPIAHARLAAERLGAASNGIYCGRAHPLYGASRVDLDDVLRHPFAERLSLDGEAPMDRWPSEHRRRVGLSASDFAIVLAACHSGEMLAVSPDVVAEPWSGSGRLRRLPVDVVPDTPLYGVRRPTIAKESCAELILAATKREIETRPSAGR